MSTTSATLTSKERVQRAFQRREHDRVPRYESFWEDTLERWEKEGLVGGRSAVHDKLRSDLRGCGWCWPAPYPGRRDVLEEDDETVLVINPWGQTERQWKHRMGTPEHHGFSCPDRESWDNEIKPKLLKHLPAFDIEASKDNLSDGRQRERWTYLAGVESFEQVRRLVGDEIALYAMADDPDWIADISRTHTDMMLANFNHAWQAGVQTDGIWIYGDMAFNHATMCSPAMYEELIWPDHKRLADWAHEHGCKFIYHTDGNCNGVLDLYLKAGFDCLQPLEAKADMDIRKLVPEYGEQLTFFGNVDVMAYATNDHEKIEDELRSKLEAGMASRGYIYHSDHSVPPQMSWECYQFVIDLLDRYGNYN